MIRTLCVFFFSALAAVSAENQPPPTLELGSAAPDFSLPGVDGETYTLDSFNDAKALVVLFTCNHCPDAIAARGRIQDLATDYKDKGVELVAISGNDPKALQLWELGWGVYGDSFDEMKTVAAETGMTFPYLYDGDEQQATLAYGAQATPHVFIFDEERNLRYQGQLDDGRRGEPKKFAARKALDEILAGEAVTTPETRVYGCSTKWSWKRELAQQKEAEWDALPVSVQPLTEGIAKTLRAPGGTLRLINFWATDCGPCIAEFPDLVDTYKRYQARDFQFITIAMDAPEKSGAVEKFLKKQNAALSPRTKELLGENAADTNNFQMPAGNIDTLADIIDSEWQGPIPHTILVDREGNIVFRHTGKLDAITLRKAIVPHLDGDE